MTTNEVKSVLVQRIKLYTDAAQENWRLHVANLGAAQAARDLLRDVATSERAEGNGETPAPTLAPRLAAVENAEQ